MCLNIKICKWLISNEANMSTNLLQKACRPTGVSSGSRGSHGGAEAA